jgi:hypothetical protein
MSWTVQISLSGVIPLNGASSALMFSGKPMLGWTLIFALMASSGAFITLWPGPGAGLASIEFATIVFSALFLACLLTRLMRPRA